MKSRSLIRPFPAFACGVLAALALVACTTGPRSEADLSLYRSVIDRVHASYVERVSDEKLLDNSLKGMLTGLDPHSDYMTESEYHEMLDDTQGEFAGIGAELTREDNRPKVISPIDDTPAARAGVRPGDIIIRIDGRSTDGMSLKTVVDTLRGPVGTRVNVTIARTGTPNFDLTLTRAVIRIASVKAHLEAGRIGYARVSMFAENTQDELVQAIDRLTKDAGGKLQGFVLDLRNDPGGLLDQAIDVAGDFLDGGPVVSTRGRTEEDNRRFDANSGGDRLRGRPLVVLINGASASAAEIVAGALHDRGRAELLGSRSFGKGSVQTIIPMDGRGALRLTTARYYTPSGRSIQGEGITPDKVVLPPKDQRSAQAEILHEADLNGALDNATVGNRRAAPTAEGAGHAGEGEGAATEASIDPQLIGTPKDYQLQIAIQQVRELAQRAGDTQLSRIK